MAKRKVHYFDFDGLLSVNQQVVALTGEKHEFTKADGEKLKELLSEVEGRAVNEGLEEAVPEKAAFLVFKLASGQHFRNGNKRTALVAGLVFLRKNGYKMEMSDPGFVSAVDKVGIAAATLDDLYMAMEKSVSKSTQERKSWETAIEGTIDANKAFLTDMGS